jgi:hypothetical protein
MDFNSVEFYVIALVIAFVLLGFLFGQKSKSPASTYFTQFALIPTEGNSDELTFEAQSGGYVEITRSGLMLRPEETANLVFTIFDDKIEIIEKVGIKVSGGEERAFTGTARVKFIPTRKFHLRYESAITTQWCTMTFLNNEGNKVKAELKY